jgi:membrane associated rhomboid family serine protease
MTDPDRLPVQEVLRLCAAAAPAPWYPETAPLPADLTTFELNACLDQLRREGLIVATERVDGHGLGYVLTVAGVGALRQLQRAQRARPLFPPQARDPQAGGDWERGEAVRNSLLTEATPTVSYVLLALNIGIFLIDALPSLSAAVIPALGKLLGLRVPGDSLRALMEIRPVDLVLGGWSWLRLLTNCFVHADILHVVMNMYALYVLGPLLERIWGHARFLLLYLVAGVGGSCVAVAMLPVTVAGGGVVRLLGASGAIWGLMVSLAVWVYLNRRYLPRQLLASWKNNLIVVFVLNVIISFIPGISAAAHFGGGAVGGLCGFFLHLGRFGRPATRGISWLGLAALPILCVAGLVAFMNRSPAWAGVRDLAPVIKAEEAKVKAGEEKADLNEVLSEVQKLERGPKEVYQALVAPLLIKHPERRDPDEVKQAIALLGEGETQLRAATDLLRPLGPFEDDRAEKARQMRIDLLEARVELFRLSKQCLEAGNQWKERDETRLLQQTRDVQKLEQQYRKILKGE